MLGPIFVALSQTAIEKGARAGIAVGFGVWTSDFLIILGSYIFVNKVDDLIHDKVFTYWMGLIGGLILLTIGIATFLNNKSKIEEGEAFKANNYYGLWLKGFLVNTINPFTFVFWLGVISNKVVVKNITNQQATIFIGSIMLTIIITDIAKVLAAKAIKSKLKPSYMVTINKIAGVALAIFGLALLFSI